jgi:hypothetical protein
MTLDCTKIYDLQTVTRIYSTVPCLERNQNTERISLDVSIATLHPVVTSCAKR